MKNQVDPPKQSKGQLYKPCSKEKRNGYQSYQNWHFQKEWKDPFTIAIDYLDLMYIGNAPQIEEEDGILELSEEIILVNKNMGTSLFSNTYEIFFEGEAFGKLFLHPRNKKILNEKNLQLHIENHQLYTFGWHTILQKVEEVLMLKLQNVTRLDIAIDGLNYLPIFLNAYHKQDKNSKIIHMTGKARLNASVFDNKDMIFWAFRIGSPSSPKYLTVYHKTAELEKSNKQYIRLFWQKNGLERESVWRTELRFRSKALKEFPDFKLKKCQNVKFLFDLFKSGCHNFLEFREYKTTDTNLRRSEKIRLMPFDYIESSLLDKSNKPLSDGTYKAKLSIHNIVKNCCLGRLKNEHSIHAIEHLKENVKLYNLYSWYLAKLPEWLKLYFRLNPESRNNLELNQLNF